jgi:hypothetical protein
MNVQVQPHFTTTQRYLPFECMALVQQGGGALGAYQAGVYEALAEAGSRSPSRRGALPLASPVCRRRSQLPSSSLGAVSLAVSSLLCAA